MKTLFIATIAVVLALPAAGEFVLFWSTTGITNADYVYSTALTNFLPYFVPPTPVTELPAGAYDLLLWGRFIADECMQPPCQVTGVDLAFAGNATVAQNAAYRHRVTGAGAYKRWDGGQGILLSGVMAAITADGIEFIVPPATNNDLYYPETHECLFGAARITGTAGQSKAMVLDAGGPLDGLGIRTFCTNSPCNEPNAPMWPIDIVVVPAVVTFFAVGDVSGDNLVTFDDIDPFVFALTHSETEFRTAYPTGHYGAADCNHDGGVNFDDIDPFVDCLSVGPCP